MVTTPDDSDDSRLLQRTADGDAKAFTELYDRYAALVFSVALKILADWEEASDVLQQVFLKLHSKASLYSPEKGRPASWLASMTRNQSLDRLRQIKSSRNLGAKLYEETKAEPGLEHANDRYARYSDEVDLLHGAMATLRPDEVLVLHLAYFGGLSQKEIAVQLAQPLGSIKARIRRALMKLRTALNGIVEQPAGTPAMLQFSGQCLPIAHRRAS